MTRHLPAIFAFAALALPVAFLPTGAEAQAPAAEPVPAELLSQGEALFAGNCKSCHGSTGGGFVGPKLVGNQRLANAEFVLRQITKGSADMPAFGKRLSEAEIEAVGTYIRNSWGNSFGPFPAP